MPGVAAVAELGFSGFEAVGWFGVLAPAGTPMEIVGKLSADIRRVLTDQQVAENFEKLGLEIVGNTPEQFSAVMRGDAVKWAKLMREAGVQPE